MRVAIFADSNTTVSGYLVPRAVEYLQEDATTTVTKVVDTSVDPVRKPETTTDALKAEVKRVLQPTQVKSVLRWLRGLPNYSSRPYPDSFQLPWKQGAEIIYPPDGDINTPEFVDKVKSWDLDYILLLGCNQILEPPLINAATKGVVNFHPAYLPEYRGVRACYWAAYHDEEETGITFHFIDEEIDQGEIVTQKRVRIPDNRGQPTVSSRCMTTAQETLREVISKLANDEPIETVEIEGGEYYSSTRYDGHGEFDVSLSANELVRRQRAEEELPIHFDGGQSLISTRVKEAGQAPPMSSEGEITRITREGIFVRLAGGNQVAISQAYYLPAWVIAWIIGLEEGDRVVE